MSPDLTAALIRDFPRLYAWPYGPENSFQFECGDGWHALIRDMSAQLVLACPDMRIEQCKSKFGGIRVHTFPFTDRTLEIVAETERQSKVTCELCGAEGKRCGVGGWTWTLCAACHESETEIYQTGRETE